VWLFDFAHSIRDDDERIVEATEIERTTCMGNVVRDADEARAPAGECVLGSSGCHLRGIDLVVTTLLDGAVSVKRHWPVGETVRDVVDLCGLEAGRLQAVQNRVARKCAG
jgi:hypothetical protein